VRRPRAWFAATHSGRPRVAVRPHYGGLPSMAGRVRMNAGESPRDQVASAPLHPEVRPRGRKSPRWSAGRRVPSPRARRASDAERRKLFRRRGIVKAPLGAPLPRFGEQERRRRRRPRRQQQGRRSVGLLRPHPEEPPKAASRPPSRFRRFGGLKPAVARTASVGGKDEGGPCFETRPADAPQHEAVHSC
jgi:hypothetical protein